MDRELSQTEPCLGEGCPEGVQAASYNGNFSMLAHREAHVVTVRTKSAEHVFLQARVERQIGGDRLRVVLEHDDVQIRIGAHDWREMVTHIEAMLAEIAQALA